MTGTHNFRTTAGITPDLPPLIRMRTTVVGTGFTVLFTPEDGVIRAAGFVTDADPEADELGARLRAVDPQLGGRPVLELEEWGAEGQPRSASDAEREHAARISAALEAYDAGHLCALDSLDVAQPETPFRGAVWRALRLVPAGAPVTYTALAALAGRPAAVRAAASGCATNLVALVVPCHRIVRADGGLGGYLFGTEVKERLLRHEAAHAVV